MTMITEFADQLFSFMAMKYEIIATNIPREANIPVEEHDWSASDEFTIDIGHAVIMLSYSYRSAFRRNFKRVSTLMSSSNAKADLYALIFAKITYKSHSPLKVLVLCAFISEMYLFLQYKSGSMSTIRDYLRPSSNCFNTVYRAVLSSVDDPILKWNDVKRVASLIASGYSVLEPIIKTEHPLEECITFFESVEEVIKAKNASAEEPHDEAEASGAKNVPTVQLPPPKASTSSQQAAKESTTASYIGKSPTKSVATDSLHSAVGQTASNILGSDGKAKSLKMTKTKLKKIRKALKNANKTVIIEERRVGSNQNASRVPEIPNVQDMMSPPDVDTLCSDRLSNLTVRDSKDNQEDESEESGEEYLV